MVLLFSSVIVPGWQHGSQRILVNWSHRASHLRAWLTLFSGLKRNWVNSKVLESWSSLFSVWSADQFLTRTDRAPSQTLKTQQFVQIEKKIFFVFFTIIVATLSTRNYLFDFLKFPLPLLFAHGALSAEAWGELESRCCHASAKYGHTPRCPRRHWAQGTHCGRGQGPGTGE